MTTEHLPGDITKVILDGSLDIAGAAAIDLKKVSFIGSMGLRTLIVPARAVTSRGGKIVVFGANALVTEILRTSGLDTVVPLYRDYATALDGLK
jgi:anti-anti-sigma factor